MALLGEVAHHIALVPLLWIGVLAFHGQQRNAVTWTVALVLSVSWVADTAAHWIDPWLVSAVYPLVQALTLGLVLLPSRGAWRLAGILGVTGVLSLVLRPFVGPEVVTHTVAWLSMVAIVWPPVDVMRRTVAVTFAALWLGWVGYTIAPSWGTWGLYQTLRAGGIGLFCWASAPQRVRV